MRTHGQGVKASSTQQRASRQSSPPAAFDRFLRKGRRWYEIHHWADIYDEEKASSLSVPMIDSRVWRWLRKRKASSPESCDGSSRTVEPKIA